MDLIIVRHGQSQYNIRQTTDMDSHLTVEGWRQAEETGKWLAKYMNMEGRFGVVSPFRRTLQTARAIAKETGVKFKVNLMVHELMVTYQSFLIENHHDDFPEFDWSAAGHDLFRMEHEDMDVYRNRMQKALNYLIEDEGDKPFLVVSHGLPCETLARIAIGVRERPETYTTIQNCGMTWIAGKHTMFFGRTMY